MILGMSVETFTMVHTFVSLIAIGFGLAVAVGMTKGISKRVWDIHFLVLTALTTITGFLFPFTGFLPSHAFGIMTLAALAVGIPALFLFRLAGRWRVAYIVTALFALYLNVFVLVVQIFLKIPAANALAPTQSEPPFAIAQTLVLAAFVYMGYLALKRFRPVVAGA